MKAPHRTGRGGWHLERDRWVQPVKSESEQALVSLEPPPGRVTLRHEGNNGQVPFDAEMDIGEVNEDY